MGELKVYEQRAMGKNWNKIDVKKTERQRRKGNVKQTDMA